MREQRVSDLFVYLSLSLKLLFGLPPAAQNVNKGCTFIEKVMKTGDICCVYMWTNVTFVLCTFTHTVHVQVFNKHSEVSLLSVWQIFIINHINHCCWQNTEESLSPTSWYLECKLNSALISYSLPLPPPADKHPIILCEPCHESRCSQKQPAALIKDMKTIQRCLSGWDCAIKHYLWGWCMCAGA